MGLLDLLRGYCKHPMKGGHLGKQKEVKSDPFMNPLRLSFTYYELEQPCHFGIKSMLDQSQATISKDRARTRRRSELGS